MNNHPLYLLPSKACPEQREGEGESWASECNYFPGKFRLIIWNWLKLEL